MSVQDRYQRQAKEIRAMEFRRREVQRYVQEQTAIRTIGNCLSSPDRATPGTFAYEVVAAYNAELGR